MEGLRPDVTLRQITRPTLAPRIRRWQHEQNPARAPIALVADRPRVAAILGAADSLALPGGRVTWLLTRAVDEAALAELAVEP